MVVQIAHNAVTAKLIGADREAKLAVNEALSYMVTGAEHMGAFKLGKWDGRSSFFNYDAATFPRGFINRVNTALVKAGYKTQLVRKPFPEPLGPVNPVVDSFGESPRYDYQPKVVDLLLRHGQIIARVATGGGKSRIARLCTARISRPTLFVTTRGILMHQMADAYRAAGRKVAVLGDGNLEVSNDVTCGMVQTIAAWLEETTPELEANRMIEAEHNRFEKAIETLKSKLVKEKLPIPEINKQVQALKAQQDATAMTPEEVEAKAKEKAAKQTKRRAAMIKVLARFEFVILEEAHEASGNSFYEVMKHCVNAHYRLALTATPFMKENEEANMRLMAASGPIAIHITEEMLIERGILAKPYFKFIDTPKPEKLFRSTTWQRAYSIGIVENMNRNKAAIGEVIRAKRHGLSSMVLVTHKKHGELICELMKKAGLRAEYIFSEDKQEERKAALGRLGRREIDVLIGTSILDVGVDVPAVGMVVLLGGGKAEVAMRQRIGRGLREKKDGSPNVCFIVDFVDKDNSHLKEHAKQRQLIVSNTPGFAENVVNDFEYERLGFKRVA